MPGVSRARRASVMMGCQAGFEDIQSVATAAALGGQRSGRQQVVKAADPENAPFGGFGAGRFLRVLRERVGDTGPVCGQVVVGVGTEGRVVGPDVSFGECRTAQCDTVAGEFMPGDRVYIEPPGVLADPGLGTWNIRTVHRRPYEIFRQDMESVEVRAAMASAHLPMGGGKRFERVGVGAGGQQGHEVDVAAVRVELTEAQ